MIYIVQLFAVACLVWVLWQNRQQKKLQDALVKPLRGKRFWRIHLARPSYHDSFWRLSPVEATGVLVDDDDKVRFLGFRLRNKKQFEVVLNKSEVTITWLGRQMFSGPFYWAECASPQGSLLFCADNRNVLQSRSALRDILSSAFPALDFGEETTADFALEKSPRSITTMVAFFGLFFFSMIDSFVISRYELTDAQIVSLIFNPLVMAATLLATGVLGFLAFQWLRRGGVPSMESWGLVALLTATCLGAALPGAKRVDQWLADAPSKEYRYRVVEIARLKPVDPNLGLPVMWFPRAKDYWQQFPVGSEYTIPFLHGPLGLWQLDHELFDPPLLKFYDKKG
ncbi:hypothetical protein [Acidovorax sp. FJL06]|uniref:hypothetical protein n=1 Tax=Acidovorax sp. FJL06 TaxID=2153365 RepID=UPI000F58341C|nr:hypothetical protein [Acidovorax sp. FJL06]RQO80301.1 hypothetical protein DBV10_20085 [Acidovorax sp. FJL06]